MLEFVFYMLLYIPIPTKQKNMKNKQIRNSTLYAIPVFFFNMHIFCHSGCPFVTSDRTHIDISFFAFRECLQR